MSRCWSELRQEHRARWTPTARELRPGTTGGATRRSAFSSVHHEPESIVNSRRQFLIQAPVGIIGAVAACRGDELQIAKGRHAARRRATRRRAADVRHRAGSRTGGLAGNIRRSGEARAGADERRRAADGGGELASIDGGDARAAHRPAKDRARADARAGDAMESGACRSERSARRATRSFAARSIPVHCRRATPTSRSRR